MRRREYVTHCQGSWRWQNRYALVEYHPHQTLDNRLIWRSYRELDGKVKPQHVDGEVGSIHNLPLNAAEITEFFGELGYRL